VNKDILVIASIQGLFKKQVWVMLFIFMVVRWVEISWDTSQIPLQMLQ
jgi:hypothetical protein